MRLCGVPALALAFLVPGAASSQETGVDPAQMEQVFPAATRFGPPVKPRPQYAKLYASARERQRKIEELL